MRSHLSGRRFVLAAAFAWGLCLSSASYAQAFPSKPLRIVVPAAAGGNLDLVTRNIAQKLSEQLGQPVIVENRPGGNYTIAVDFVAKAPADGYTYLAVADSFLYTPAIVRTATFDPLKDFSGVGMYATVPQILVVGPGLGLNSVKDLIAFGKAKPGALTFGTAGAGATGHLAAELFSAQAGVQMTHVPYKGNAPALIDVMGDRVSLIFDTISTSLGHVKSGKLKALAVTTTARTPILPEVPTVSEAGVPGYEATIFNGLVARAGTPPEFVARINSELRKVAQQPDLRARFLEQGIELKASESPGQFDAYMKALSERYLSVIKKANIRAD